MKSLASAIVLGLFSSTCLAQDAQPPMKENPAEKPAQVPKLGEPKAAEPEKPARQTENLPTAESLFEKHIAAIGGIEALKAEKNRMVKASYVGPGRIGEGALRVMRVPPNKFYQTLEIPGVVSQEIWCNGEEGWMRDTNNGTNKLKGDALIEYKRMADFLGEANYKSRYKEITTVYGEKFNGVDAFAVKAVPVEGKERFFYFDAKAGFIIGMRNFSPNGPESDTITTLSDYKDFSGVKHPTKSVIKEGKFETVITIKKVDSNLSAMPSTEPPDEVKSVK